MAHAAASFLASLTAVQARFARWPFPSDHERRQWYYTPTDHGGLPLSMMTAPQYQLAMRLLAAGLSRAAYTTVCTVIGLENVLDELEDWSAKFGRDRGRDPGLYYLRIFGEPRHDRMWSWRFGGHHVSVQYLITEGRVSATTPRFIGADPASAQLLGGQRLRPLGKLEDLGLELMRALDLGRRRQAVISRVPPIDLVGSNRSRLTVGATPRRLTEIWRTPFRDEVGARLEQLQTEGEARVGLHEEHIESVRLTSEPKGIQGSGLTMKQQRLLRTLLETYVGQLPRELARGEATKFAGRLLENLWFAWAGGIRLGEPHYYRLQGPGLLIEYDNVQRDANHIHSVVRDPDGDFGDDILARHYAQKH